MANENDGLTLDGLAAKAAGAEVKASVDDFHGAVEDGITPVLEDLNSRVEPIAEDIAFIADTFEDLKISLELSSDQQKIIQERTLELDEEARKIEAKASSVKKLKPNLSDVAAGGLKSLGFLLLYNKFHDLQLGITKAGDESAEQLKGMHSSLTGIAKKDKKSEGGKDSKMGAMMESFAKTVKTTIGDAATSVKKFTVGGIAKISNVTASIGDRIGKTFTSVTSTFTGALKGVGDTLTAGLDKVSSGLLGSVKSLTTGVFSMFKQLPALVLGFFGKIKSFFAGIFNKKKEGGKPGADGVSAQHVLILASDIKNAKEAMSGYEAIIKATSRSKKISIESLQKIQENLDAFVKTLADRVDKDKKQFTSAKKYVKQIVDVIGTFAQVGQALLKVIAFTPIFLVGQLTLKFLKGFLKNLKHKNGRSIIPTMPKGAKQNIKQIVGVLESFVAVGVAATKLAIFGPFFLAAGLSLKALNFFFNKFKDIITVIDSLDIDFKAAKKTFKNIQDVLISVVISAAIVAISAPMIFGALLGLIPLTAYILAIKGLVNLAGGIDRKVLNNAIMTVNIMFMFAASMILTSIAFAALLVLTPFAMLAVFYLKDLTRDFTMLIERLDNNNLKKVKTALMNVVLMTTFATLYLAFTMILALTTPFAILAAVGLLVMVGIGLLINLVGIVFNQAMKSVLSIILVSVAMVVMALAMTATVMLLAYAGNIIATNLPQILYGLGGMVVFTLMIVGLGVAMQAAMPGILGAIIAFAAVVLFAFAAEYAIKVFSNITIDSIMAAAKGVGKFMILFGVIALAGIAAAAAVIPLGFLLVASVLMLGATAAMLGTVKILNNLDEAEIAAASKNVFKAVKLYMAAALAGVFALLAVPGAAAMLVVSVALLPASLALLGTVKVLSSKDLWQNIVFASINMVLAGVFFAVVAVAGIAALVAVPGAAGILASSILLLPGTLAFAGAINAMKLVNIGSVLAAALTMAAAGAFFTTAAITGLASLLALPGLVALAASSALLYASASPLSKAIAEINRMEDLKGAKGKVKDLREIISDFGGMGKPMTQAQKFFDAVKANFTGDSDDSLDKFIGTIKKFDSLSRGTSQKVKVLSETLTELKKIGKFKADVFSNLGAIADPLKKFFTQLNTSFNMFKQVVGQGITPEQAKVLRSSLNEVSKINTKNFGEFTSEIMKSAQKLDPVATSINRISESIRGLNTELQTLNQQGGAVKMFTELQGGDPTATTPDAKAEAAKKKHGDSGNVNAEIKQTLVEIKETLDKFSKSYDKNNRSIVGSWLDSLKKGKKK